MDLAEKNQNGRSELALHQASEFTEEQYEEFKTNRIKEIRKLLSEGVIPPNYNYSDVPMLAGSFVNETHILRKNGDLVNIHLQEDKEKRIRDFKWYNFNPLR